MNQRGRKRSGSGQKYALALLVLGAILLLTVILCLQGLDPEEQTPPQTTATTVTEATEPLPTWATYPEDRELTAQQAFVYDVQAERYVYLTGDAGDRVYPASITKLFTAYVALQLLEPQRQITAGDALELVGPGSSVAQLCRGDTLTTEQLVEGMLLPSGNDAAYILAVEAGRELSGDTTLSASDAAGLFMEKMNAVAVEQGMTGTRFQNPDGYHESDHYTCYRDLVTIGKLSLQTPQILRYAAVSTHSVTVESGTYLWKNTNALVDPDSPYYCAAALGLKTGQTPSAGSCLLSAFEVRGQQYIIGVFGCPEEEDRFADTLQLLNRALEG